MGNCLYVNKVQVHEEPNKSADLSPPPPEKNSEPISKPVEVRKKKTVRFKLDDEVEEDSDNDNKKCGVVKFRIKINQEELDHFLSCNKGFKYSSVEDLLNAMKLSGRKIIEVRRKVDEEEDVVNGWKPVLESIPEVH